MFNAERIARAHHAAVALGAGREDEDMRAECAQEAAAAQSRTRARESVPDRP